MEYKLTGIELLDMVKSFCQSAQDCSNRDFRHGKPILVEHSIAVIELLDMVN